MTERVEGWDPPPLFPGALGYFFLAAFLVAFFLAAFFLTGIFGNPPFRRQIWTDTAPLFNISGDKGLDILAVA
jgi:hypothetical protein